MSRLLELGSEGGGAVGVGERARGLAEVLERYAVVVLVMLAVAGFALRVGGAARLGFAEDEINKLEAVRAYAHGDLTQNAEHPVLMKALIFASVGAAHWWNEHAASLDISEETALRLHGSEIIRPGLCKCVQSRRV